MVYNPPLSFVLFQTLITMSFSISLVFVPHLFTLLAKKINFREIFFWEMVEWLLEDHWNIRAVHYIDVSTSKSLSGLFCCFKRKKRFVSEFDELENVTDYGDYYDDPSLRDDDFKNAEKNELYVLGDTFKNLYMAIPRWALLCRFN